MSSDDEEMWGSYGVDAVEAIRGIEESLLALEAQPKDLSHLNRLCRGFHTLKGNSGFLELRELERTAHMCEDLVMLVRDKGSALDLTMVNLLLEALDLLRWAVDFVGRERRDVEPSAVEKVVARIASTFAERGGVRRGPTAEVAVEIITEESLAAMVAADLPEAPRTMTPSAPITPVPRDRGAPSFAPPSLDHDGPSMSAAAPAPAKARKPAERAPDERTEFLRIDASKVALLMDLAGELGLACSSVTRHPDVLDKDFEGFAIAAHKLERLVREMQNDLSSLRLVPVASVFSRMKRVVRDAAQRTGKEVDFRVQGEETEVDKVMLDLLADPLVHVLRNAVDHGIESAEVRRAANKPAVGRITLSATHQGGEVTIEVRDDGRGLDRELILERARERGLVARDAVLTEEEVHELLFVPGFSTKKTADILSGRGVGMDVLKTTMAGLRGKVRLKSRLGQGSSIKMTMPLTLAFVEAMVVREHDRLFAVPIEKVFEVSRVQKAQVVSNTANGQVMIRVHESYVPVLWLHRYWGEERAAHESLDDRIVVVVQTARGALALPVDELIGNQQVMLKPLRGVLSHIRAAAGCGMLRTGDVAVALDCEQLHA